MLSDKITSYSAKIAVVGLGYVGLPLACLTGIKGYSVLGIDLDRDKIASLRQGKSYISDIPDMDLKKLIDRKVIQFNSGYNELSSCDVIVICVPTPLDAACNPDYSFLLDAVREISLTLRREQLVIVESTVAPGTTEGKILPLLQNKGLAAGSDFFLSYSPERLDPGNKSFGVSNIPKLVAGLTPACRNLACRFYEQLGLTVVPVAALAAAELSKLLENTYRDVNIALVNEMAQVCRANGIDIWQVVDAAATKPFGFQSFYPGPGVGGHCIPVDSVYYTSWARNRGTPAKLAELARRINAAMPDYITGLIRETLAAANKSLNESKVLILGVTYKRDVNDIRESAVIKLIKKLQKGGAQITFHDPLVKKIKINRADLHSVPLGEDTLLRQDCVILAVDHSAFDISWLDAVSPVLVDLTNALAEHQKVRNAKQTGPV
ncbi:MAG: nucleotide sugar dehydrogenase [Bacillota bacterium]|nr:nucleotide sugar dehydrogenase [Bacillota bacterium]MDW7684422.1 nucleotide sugar dehydrogenase [Bacillota bacterium]